jgi:hypothetical protein
MVHVRTATEFEYRTKKPTIKGDKKVKFEQNSG